MSNENLWEKFIFGDKDALTALYNSVYDDLYNYGYKLVRKQEIVNDSIQDLFLKLWKNKKNLGKIEQVKPYLFKALRRHIVSNLQWNKKFMVTDQIAEDFFDIEYSHEDFITQEQVNKEKTDRLIQMLNELTARQKEALYLRYFQGYEFEMISEIMNMNVQSVRNTLHRGLTNLREMLPVFLLLV